MKSIQFLFLQTNKQEDALYSLYQSALSPETVNEATKSLIHLYDNPEIIFQHFLLLDHISELKIRRYVLIKLPALIKEHLISFPIEKIKTIEEALLKLIQEEQDLNCRYFLCDSLISLITKFLKHVISENESINVIEFFNSSFTLGNELLKTEEFLSTGLSFWQDLFPLFQESAKLSSGEENPEIVITLCFTLLQISSNALTSENSENRIQAMKLIDALIDYFANVDIEYDELHLTVISEFFGLLLGEFNQATNPETFNSSELTFCCSLIASLFDQPLDFVQNEHLFVFLEATLSIISNFEIPSEIRYIVHTILESSSDLIVLNEQYREQINNIIGFSVHLAIEMCIADRDDNNYEFAYPFFYSLSDAYNDSESNGNFIFDLFMECALSISKESDQYDPLIGRQISLFVIKSIIESLQEIVSNRIGDVVPFLLTLSDVDDQYVFNSACSTIEEIFEFVPNAASKFIDEFTQFFVKYINFPLSIPTLDSILFRSDKPPSDVETLFSGLSSLVSDQNSSEVIETVLSCISSLFSRYPTTEETVLASFLPIISPMMEARPELHSAILDFFGRIINVAPLTIQSELDTLANFAIQSFSLNVTQYSISAASFLKSIAKVLPISFQPYLSEAVPPLIAILQQEEDEEEEDEEMNEFPKLQKEAMLALSTFIGYMPEPMAEYSQTPILDFIVSEKGGLDRYTVTACESLAYACEGFKSLGIPVFNVLETLLPRLIESEIDKDKIFSILMVTSEIVSVFGDVMPDNIVELFISTFIGILESPPSSFLLTESVASIIDPSIQTPLFLLLSESADIFGEKYQHAIPKLSQILLTYFNDSNYEKSLILKSNALLFSAHLCCSCHIVDAFSQMVQNTAVKLVTSSNSEEANIILAKTIKYLILADKTQLQDRLNILVPFSSSVIENGNYFGLFCAIIMNYCTPADIPKFLTGIQRFIEYLPPVIDSEDIVFYSEFTFFLLSNNIEMESLKEKLPMTASALYASSDRHFNSANPATRQPFREILSGLSQEDISTVMKSDESKLAKIANRLANP